MRMSFVPPCDCEDGVLALLAAEGPVLSASARAADEAAGGGLTRAMAAQRFRGRLGETLQLLAPAGSRANQIVLLGMGPEAAADAALFERLGGELYAALARGGERIATVAMPDGPAALNPGEAAARLAFGAELRAHSFDRYRTRQDPEDVPALTSLVVATADPKAAKAAWRRLEAVSQGVFLARDLVSEPANALDPKAFADRMKALTDLGVQVEVLGEAAMRKLGFGALLGVSQGSAKEPQLVLLDYDGRAPKSAAPPVVMVGKGVTFDAGGISIKPAAGMETMKWDMGGAAAIAGAIRALALRKARCRVVGVCAMVENMPSATAQRPGDVVTSLSGQTIEVIDTDCEGRLILADAIAYAQQRYAPAVVIDLATLTSACVTALGREYAGLFCNDDALAGQLAAAGEATGERLWRLPMGEAYDRQLASDIADMKNVAGRDASASIAAQFIRRFVAEGVAWAHLDIAGTVWADEDTPLCRKGATGFGARVLEEFVSAHHERA